MQDTMRVAVTGDIIIQGQACLEKAFKPALAFLEGYFTEKEIKKWILTLEFLVERHDKLKLHIDDPYQRTSYGEYVILYDSLKIQESQYQFTMNIKELLDRLKVSLIEPKPEVMLDNTTFMQEFIDATIKNLKDQDEFS